MCEPTLIMTGVSMVATGYQAKQQGDYENKVAEYNARVQDNAATDARNKAQDVRRVGNDAENLRREETSQLLSKQRAQLGASGVSLEGGSALDIQSDTVSLGEADARRVKANYDMQVTELNLSADNLNTQAKLTLADGRAKKAAGSSKLGASLFGAGAGAVSSKWF